ncbi:hypothetical protein [Lentzea jiangxiensis]|uniref:HEAT repeat-containing protein n=1 Tax=Lentzea jiangxiensis TaxID=641025 RepID=A0A1H0NSQ1_9PSEU|nr:hypothetical protein [Lentzea jiangxiensis]SDO95495.1 hypothetical protein SAMN05421507_104519 [Lentzea jiangxiensis]
MELPRAWQRPDPLRGLDRIPWSEVHDGRGGAGRVPRLLRSLVDPAADVRLEAFSSLADRLLTDDTVSQASFCAVPFLVELGASYKVAGDVRDRVVFLLAALALAGKGYTEDGRRTHRRWNALGRELPRTAPDWLTQTRHAVAQGAPKIFEALASERVACLVALACAVPERLPTFVHGLMQEMTDLPGEEMLAEAAEIAVALLRGTPELLGLDVPRPKVLGEGLVRPAHQPREVAAALMGYRFALISAYGDEGAW